MHLPIRVHPHDAPPRTALPGRRMEPIRAALLPLVLLTLSPACQHYSAALYPTWTDVDRDCRNVRADVLIRNSLIGVKFRGEDKCLVDSGYWVDPYTDNSYLAASQIEIDHLIPLAEAHRSGAWAWTAERKKSFANSMDSSYYLLTASVSSNRSKGDKDPAKWLPPDTKFRSLYAMYWISAKLAWGLQADKEELKALQNLWPGSSIGYPREAPEDTCTDSSTGIAWKPVPQGRSALEVSGWLAGVGFDLNGRTLSLSPVRTRSPAISRE